MLRILDHGVSGMKVLKINTVCCFLVFLGVSAMANANVEILDEIKKCPKSPNCVSTLTDSQKHKMEPWSVESAEALKRIKKAALIEPRSKLITESDTHLQFTFKSYVFRFVDDVWFAFRDGKIHYKSAARTGYRDFNKNKERMERIRDRVFK